MEGATRTEMQSVTDAAKRTSAGFQANVRGLIAVRVDRIAPTVATRVDTDQFLPGKMLRTRFAAQLVTAGLCVRTATLERVCAATELIHTASLCHDDVIDNAVIRRFRPTLWRETSPSGAVLIGDLLLCEALDLLLDAENGRYTRAFVAKVRELCSAEAEQELVQRGEQLDEPACLRIARGKAGSLFAFIGEVCGGDDAELSAALEEAGYAIGAAYQLSDDLLDIVGDEDVAGKTLRTDAERRKFTLPHVSEERGALVWRHVAALCGAARSSVAAWPEIQNALEQFLACDLQPALDRIDTSLNTHAEPST